MIVPYPYDLLCKTHVLPYSPAPAPDTRTPTAVTNREMDRQTKSQPDRGKTKGRTDSQTDRETD